ncbi:MAG: oxidoreductase [Chloroflexota bacterium]
MGRLAEPFAIRGMRLRNRVVMLPMVTNLATAEGFVTDALVAHYADRARRDAALVIVESTGVHPTARNITQGVGIWDDAFIPGLRRLAAGIKAGGAAAAIQIFHAGAKTHPGLLPVSASGMALRGGERPRVLSKAELPGIVGAFGEAAGRALEAGFDAVEIHVAHFYLLCEFLSPFTNHRADGYGGDPARRARLAVEAVVAARAAVGPDFPILVRMHGAERIEGGLSSAEVLASARLFVAAGADAIDVSMCNQCTVNQDDLGPFYGLRPYLTKADPAGAAAPQAAAIRAAAGVPVIAVGKLGDAEAAERALTDGGVDLIGVGRAFLADAALAAKMLAGRGEDVVACTECFHCLDAVVGKNRQISCPVNPALGRGGSS